MIVGISHHIALLGFHWASTGHPSHQIILGGCSSVKNASLAGALELIPSPGRFFPTPKGGARVQEKKKTAGTEVPPLDKTS